MLMPTIIETLNNDFTGKIGSAKSSKGPYIANTNCDEVVVLLRPKVLSKFINNEIISVLSFVGKLGLTIT